MKIACISASNSRKENDKSTSDKVCRMIRDIASEEVEGEIKTELIFLKNYSTKPCKLCGACYLDGLCPYDEDFNKLLKSLENVQGVFMVVPHYSPIPSKLLMILEKLNEISYAGWINNPDYQSPFYKLPVGIIGHGGMVDNEANIRYYHDKLISPVANTLKALSFHIVQANEEYPDGQAFGLKDDSCIKKSEESVFPDIIQDWTMIEERIKPFIIKCIREMSS